MQGGEEMREKVYAVIDTNVLVSAMLSSKKDTATVRIIKSIQNNRICPVYNQEVLDEYIEVLSRPKFKQPTEDISGLMDMIKKFGVKMSRTAFKEAMIDEKDRVFYEVSLTGDSYLVTGNLKHFPITPRVVTPLEMMRILDEMYIE